MTPYLVIICIVLCSFVLQFASAKEVTSNRDLCLKNAAPPDININADYNYIDQGILIWKENGKVKTVTEAGTMTLGQGSCNMDPKYNIYDAVAEGLNLKFNLTRSLYSLNPKMKIPLVSKTVSVRPPASERERLKQQMRDILHNCEGLSPNLDSAIAKLWDEYNQIDKKPLSNSPDEQQKQKSN